VKVLVTGAGGFAGGHLVECLLGGEVIATPEAVWGCDLATTPPPYLPPTVRWLAADLRQPEAARQVIETGRPDRIYHLAAQAFAGDSWANPWPLLETNLRSQVNLCEAVLAAHVEPRILVVGSGEAYGRVTAADLPINENCPLRPYNPYGVSKVAQDLLGYQYHLSRGLAVVRVRPFNHLGPRQSRLFVAPAFAAQIAAIEQGRQPPIIRVGNLEARRDFTDVRDMVRAYVLALERCTPGEAYNIGAGRSYGIRQLLEMLLSLSSVAITVETDPQRLRPAEVPETVCDASKFRACTGWTPQIPFERSVRDVLEYERAQLEHNAP